MGPPSLLDGCNSQTLDPHIEVVWFWSCLWGNTVDGRNPANQLIGKLPQYLQGSFHPRWLAGFLPSTVSHLSFGGGPCYMTNRQAVQNECLAKKALWYMLTGILCDPYWSPQTLTACDWKFHQGIEGRLYLFGMKPFEWHQTQQNGEKSIKMAHTCTMEVWFFPSFWVT